MNYCEIRCPKETWVGKYKKYLPCQNLIVKVEPGSKGEGYCFVKDAKTNIRHGTFLFEVDKDYVPPPKKTIKVQKA